MGAFFDQRALITAQMSEGDGRPERMEQTFPMARDSLPGLRADASLGQVPLNQGHKHDHALSLTNIAKINTRDPKPKLTVRDISPTRRGLCCGSSSKNWREPEKIWANGQHSGKVGASREGQIEDVRAPVLPSRKSTAARTRGTLNWAELPRGQDGQEPNPGFSAVSAGKLRTTDDLDGRLARRVPETLVQLWHGTRPERSERRLTIQPIQSPSKSASTERRAL